MDDYRRANQALWNEWTHINARSKMYDVEGFRAGNRRLHSIEVEEMGNVTGKTLLHLQCHFGLDTLSWADRGAVVTGVDFSPEAVALAESLSRECQIPARFTCCDIYDLPDHLDEQFDIVFTSYGVLTWLSDLHAWAQLVVRYLKPGGTFYIAEFHPFAMVFDDLANEPRLGYPYFNQAVIECQVQGSYADSSAPTQSEVSYEWAYPMGTVISELISAGLQIQYLHEFPFSVYRMFPYLEQGQDGYWYLPKNTTSLPLMFSLKALKG